MLHIPWSSYHGDVNHGAGLELEVKRGTAKIAVEVLVKRRAPAAFSTSLEGHHGKFTSPRRGTKAFTI